MALEGGSGAPRGGSRWIEWNPDPLSGSGLDIISRCFDGSPLSPCPEFSLFLSPCFVSVSLSALVPASIPVPLPAPFSYSGSLIVLSSGHLPALAAIFCRGISALILPLLVLGILLSLGPSLLRTFKQFLSDEPWPCVSTSSAKLLCPFLALGALNPDNNNGLYNPTNKNKHKWCFDPMFINSHLLASNHD